MLGAPSQGCPRRINTGTAKEPERVAQTGRAFSPRILQGDVGRCLLMYCHTLVWFASLALLSLISDSKSHRPTLYQLWATHEVKLRICLTDSRPVPDYNCNRMIPAHSRTDMSCRCCHPRRRQTMKVSSPVSSNRNTDIWSPPSS